MTKHDDPRAKRTRQLIQLTFAELMKEKGFDAVIIQDIADKATINRATFYAHYRDKYAVLDEITTLAFEKMIPVEIAHARKLTEDVCNQLVDLTYSYIIAFYRTCNFDTKSIASQVDGRVKEILHRTIESILIKSGTSADSNITAAVISSAIYGAAYHWYRSNKGDAIEQLKDVVIPFMMNGLQNRN